MTTAHWALKSTIKPTNDYRRMNPTHILKRINESKNEKKIENH